MSALKLPITCPLNGIVMILSDSYGIPLSLSKTSIALWYTLSLYPGPS